MSTVSQKLIARLKNELDFNVVSLERIRRGKHQMASGQYAWQAILSTGVMVGSEDTMTDCVNAVSLSTLNQYGSLLITAETK